jgi:hypothetical protein
VVFKVTEKPPTFCASVTCTSDECCEYKNTCNDVDCGEYQVLKENAGDCPGNDCTAEHCCIDRGTCPKDAECAPEKVLKADTSGVLCASSECTQKEIDADCCEDKGVCDYSVCEDDDAVVFKVTEKPPTFCAAVTCTSDECCEYKNTCDDVDCGEYQVLKENAGDCPGNDCTAEHCCIDRGTCPKDAKCASEKVLKADMAGVLCASSECTKEEIDAECCEARGVCVASVCDDDDDVVFKVTDKPTFCAAVTCTSDECCEYKGTCPGDNYCTDGNVPKAGGTACEGAKCAEDECCEYPRNSELQTGRLRRQG